MQKTKKTSLSRDLIYYGPSGSVRVGELSEGCKRCITGEKIVLYTTGHCSIGCAYCPIPEDKQLIDDVFVNERRIDVESKDINVVFDESNISLASGAGITGGDPMEVPERTISYLKRLRNKFGNKYHLHLYTSGFFFIGNMELIDKLFDAGLDELRFHPKNISAKPIWEIASLTKEKFPHKQIGFEVPAIPGQEDKIKELIRFADKHQLDFVNLNEYEFTSTNFNKLSQRGFVAVLSNSAIIGSKETALAVLNQLKNETSITIHFCTSGSKDSIQLVQRFKKRASQIKRSFDDISDEGELEYGRFLVHNEKELKELENLLVSTYELEEEMFEVILEELSIETGWFIVEEISNHLREYFLPEIQAEVLARHPIKNGPITWVNPK